jgi:hypothetical protein
MDNKQRKKVYQKQAKMMKQYDYLDTSERICPCGSSFRWSFDDRLNDWMTTHKPHTNGKMEVVCTADGARAYGGSVPAPYITDI